MSTSKARTAQALRAEIERLQAEYEDVVRLEREGVLARIVDSMLAYGISVAEVNGAWKGRQGTPAAPAAADAAPTTNHAKASGPRPIKYRDDKGNTWSGMARLPRWIEEHEKAGGSREDFRVKEAA